MRLINDFCNGRSHSFWGCRTIRLIIWYMPKHYSPSFEADWLKICAPLLNGNQTQYRLSVCKDLEDQDRKDRHLIFKVFEFSDMKFI